MLCIYVLLFRLCGHAGVMPTMSWHGGHFIASKMSIRILLGGHISGMPKMSRLARQNDTSSKAKHLIELSLNRISTSGIIIVVGAILLRLNSGQEARHAIVASQPAKVINPIPILFDPLFCVLLPT
jgi:hypothetical protein